MDWTKCAAFLCIVLITQSKRQRKGEAEWKGEKDIHKDKQGRCRDKQTYRQRDREGGKKSYCVYISRQNEYIAICKMSNLCVMKFVQFTIAYA